MGKSQSRQLSQYEPVEEDNKEKKRPKGIKVALLGRRKVGKSALVVRFVSREFLVDYDPTIVEWFFVFVLFVSLLFLLTKWFFFSDRRVVRLEDDGEDLLFDLLGLFFSSWKRNTEMNDSILLSIDTAGQEEFTVLRDSYMNYNQSFIFVYSVTSKSSFEEIRTFYEQVQRVKRENPVGILIGNKIDLESEREVSTEEGENLGIELNLPFLETSALNNTNVEEMYQLIGSHTIYGERTNCAKISKKIKPARQISPKTLFEYEKDRKRLIFSAGIQFALRSPSPKTFHKNRLN